MPPARAVHARPRPVEPAGRVQPGKQDPVQPVEDPGLLPPLQAPPAELPRAEPQPRGQELPRDVVCRGRAGHPAHTAGHPPAAALATSPAKAPAAARSVPTSHRPRSTAECSRTHERPHHHTDYARPEHLNKTLLQALKGPGFNDTRPDRATQDMPALIPHANTRCRGFKA